MCRCLAWQHRRSRCPPPPAARPRGRGPRDSNDRLLLRAKPQFGGTEETVDDIETAGHPVVDEARLALLVEHEQRRRLADGDTRGKFDEGLATVVECAQRPPVRRVTGDRIVEVEARDRKA